ncbi:MAG: SdpI family protein [Chloroflexi bacterium]|nr:SdpI family protein [Chloroflexota bacterium]
MTLVLFLVTLASVALVVVGLLALFDKLPPNGIVGIRTPYTRQSADNWYRTHRAGAPYLIFGGVAAAAAGLAFLPFALAGKVGDAVIGMILIFCAVVIVASAFAAWMFGTRRARTAR